MAVRRLAYSLSLTVALVLAMIMLTVAQATYENYYRLKYRPLRMGTQVEITLFNNVLIGNCSIGFPAYYDYYSSPDRHFRIYGIVIASHCANEYDYIYQNETSDENYIGFLHIDGRLGYGEEIINPNIEVDAAFVYVESRYCSAYCPGPQVVSRYIQYGSGLLQLDSYINSNEELESIWRSGRTVYLVGRTSGLLTGHITTYMVYDEPLFYDGLFGWVFPVDCTMNRGDSGGLVFVRVGIGRDIDEIALGTVVGIAYDYINGGYVTLVAPVHIIESELNIYGYRG